jgi:hypothetical protein
MAAALHRHGRERHQGRQRLHAGEKMFVIEAAPIGSLFGRKLVAETVEPAADDLAVDRLLRHPGAPLLDIAQKRHHRSRHLGAGEGKAQLALFLPGHEGGEQAALRLHLGEERRRHEMGMAVDDHVFCAPVKLPGNATPRLSPSLRDKACRGLEQRGLGAKRR